jgi:hypothetical protein
MNLRTRRRLAHLCCCAPMLCALAAACTGQIGDGLPLTGASDPDASSAPFSDTGTASLPFDALSVASYVNKVKTVLTGMAATQKEIDAVSADSKTLSDLVLAWTQLPAYRAKIEIFFADAFQQSQARQTDFKTVIDDGTFSPNDGLLLNYRQMFSKTMMELVAEHRPCTEAATTTRYMMTTALMTYYAYADSSLLTDDGDGARSVNRFYEADPNWTWKLTARQIPLAESGNPASPNYLVFSLPTLSSIYGTSPNASYCGGIDPVVFTAESSFALGSASASWLFSFLRGENFWFFDPPQNKPNAKWCQGGGGTTDSHNVTHKALITEADYSDWRMVTVQRASSLADQTRFFDIAGNRASNTLAIFSPRLGYFTTPAFLSQYSTNISNQARGVTNQTMIVGLGQGFDGTDPIPTQDPPLNLPGLDSEHASKPACSSCHWSLDPMRRFFRSSFSLNYSGQLDPAQTSVPGTFLFGNVIDKGGAIFDLGKQIAAHPRFKIAWTKKLCEWANSAPCSESDPELQRVAQVFADHNYDWDTLVHELFTSPLITYASRTQTAEANGTLVAIARRAQLCATLSNRLGLEDLCGLSSLQAGSCATNCPPRGTTVPSIAAQLPSDGYSRGQVSALYVANPDPFFRSSVEQICALVADQVVDSKGGALYSSESASGAIADMVHNLMGLDASRDSEPMTILNKHYTAVMSRGESPTVALKSTFTLACLSPWVVSIGQ